MRPRSHPCASARIHLTAVFGDVVEVEDEPTSMVLWSYVFTSISLV
jgi:hypothetical protein